MRDDEGRLNALDESGRVWIFRPGEVTYSWVTGNSRAEFAWHEVSPKRVGYEDWVARVEEERQRSEAYVREQRRTQTAVTTRP